MKAMLRARVGKPAGDHGGQAGGAHRVIQLAPRTASSRPLRLFKTSMAPLMVGNPCAGLSGDTVTDLTTVSSGSSQDARVAIM